MRLVGLHLLPSLDPVDARRPSAVAELDQSGTLLGLAYAASLDDVVEAIGPPPGRVLVDAPLVVANEAGRRDVESVLSWCDVPAFPVSRRRMLTVFGGVRGGELRARTPAALRLSETLPDLALRLLAWEEDTGGVALDLAEYRSLWLGVRPPAYRPKGVGRARPQGIVAAYALLARHVDMGGWRPADAPDDWTAIRDAAALDAIACAYVAWREAVIPYGVMHLGSAESGEMVVPVDVNLRSRIELTLLRLREEGAITI